MITADETDARAIDPASHRVTNRLDTTADGICINLRRLRQHDRAVTHHLESFTYTFSAYAINDRNASNGRLAITWREQHMKVKHFNVNSFFQFQLISKLFKSKLTSNNVFS